MEPAWVKVQERKFALLSRTYQLPNGGTKEVPCYVLTKTECLYIATKFNDEARAKLVLRWQELEEEKWKAASKRGQSQTCLSYAEREQTRPKVKEESGARPKDACYQRDARKWKEVRCLPSPKEILRLADEIIGEGLRMVNEPAWEKITGLKFQLSGYKDSTGRSLPCYQLTKTECLYIATKFNDEARAKLVLRWQELEEENGVKVGTNVPY